MSDRLPDCDAFDAHLSDYLEGTLDAATRAECESHASRCARCDALLGDLTAISRDARSLPALAPARDLWSGIATRIEAPVVELPPLAARDTRVPAPRRLRWTSPAGLAAAAAVLVAVTAGITYRVATRMGASGGAATVAQHTPDAGPIAAPGVARAAAALPAERVYDREIARLESIVRDQRTQLDDSTIAVIERNLAIIDSAIGQSRAALARDPRSRLLTQQLNDALNQKVELLRTAALLPAGT